MRARSPGSSLTRRRPSLLVVIVALTAAAAANAQSTFRFLCNGIDASGNPSGDQCTSSQGCTSSNAARWQPGTVAYSYDKTTRPSQISSTRWNTEIAAARQAWMNASSALNLSDSGGSVPSHSATNPAFGVEDGSNSIYWIMTNAEWNASAGSNATAALGVTISLNNRCSGDLSIFDADTVLNGAPESAFDWSFNSSLGTLTHEMGHGLGLGHPCTDSCGELMEAASGGGPNGCGDDPSVCFDPTGPQQGDIAGIQQLYGASGSIGSACSGGGCDSGLSCQNVGGTSFCTQSCTPGTSGTCPGGMVCASVNGGNSCVFSSSPIAAVGDACGPPGCVSTCPVGSDGFQSGASGCNLCLPISQTASQCFAGCDPTATPSTCPGAAPCQALTDQQGHTHGGACEPPGTAQKGQTCDGSTGCITGLECILNSGSTTTGTCTAPCDATTGVGCDNTETCLAILSDNTAICLTHGNLPVGSSCDQSRFDQCDRGELCIPEAQNGPATCHAICSQGYSCPSSSDQCVSAGGVLSVCIGGSTGEGEGEGGAGEGEGEGGPPPTGQCRISRGNFDCPNATDACVTANASDLVGTCTGTSGSTKTFDSCSSDSQCTTGLCLNGVCTVPCDIEQCPAGYTCDAGKAPAEKAGGTPGICVPDSCDANHAVCDSADGFHCIYSPEQHYVCAKDGAPLCACTTTTKTTPLAGIAVLLGLVALQRKRKTV